MAAPTETYIDPADGATNGNDHGGAAFVDGSFANATNTLTKIGAFPAATCQAGDKIWLDDNGSGQVTPGLYTISVRTDNDNVVLTADIRSGAPDPVDVRCDQHTGAVGLPWATVQHALDFTTRDAVDGDRFNVRDTADDVLAAALDFTAYGAPTRPVPFILQGYTTAAGDGGIGGIDGAANFRIFGSTALNGIRIIDMHLHNTGATEIVFLNDDIILINVEIDNTTSHGVRVDNRLLIIDCYIHNVGARGIEAEVSPVILNNTFENGANDFTVATHMLKFGGIASDNIMSIDGASDGIVSAEGPNIIKNNSIYSNGGTGQGIIAGGKLDSVYNNIVEGFSGIGGINYDINNDLALYGHNKAFNGTANFDILAGTTQMLDLGNNDVLLASPFTNPGAGNFEVDTTVQAAGWPDDFPGIATDTFIDAGAAQREEAGGGVVGWW